MPTTDLSEASTASVGGQLNGNRHISQVLFSLIAIVITIGFMANVILGLYEKIKYGEMK